jgi:hypothetical protein
MTARLRPLLVLLLLCAAAWTFREVPGFGSLPLADDDTNIFFNPHLSAPGASSLRWMFTNLDYVHRYMPLGWLGFSAAYVFTGLDPLGYHVANVLLHGLDAWLLFLLLVRLLQRFRPNEPEADRLLAAAAAALLWVVHPLRDECVATCSGMLYSQALFFALLAVHARVSEVEARVRGSAHAGWLMLGFAGYAASVLTYPVALFLPPAMLILDLAWAGRGRLRGLLPGFLSWGAVAAASIALNVEARYTVRSFLLPVSLRDFGVLPRLLQASFVCAVYVWKTLRPACVLRMADTMVFDVDPALPIWWLCAGLVLGMSLLAWALRRRAPYFGLAWLAYVVLLVPNLGFMEHPHTAADRYSYLSGCAFSVILGFGLMRLRPAARPAAWAACLACAAVCAPLALRQARVWRDAPSYFAAVLTGTRLDYVRHITVSRQALLQFSGGDVRGGRVRAWEELQRAPDVAGVGLTWKQMAPASPLPPEVAARTLEEWPAAPWSVLHLQIALQQMKEGRIDDALAHLDAALELSPDYADARFTRGALLADLGRGEAAHDWLVLRGDLRPGDRGRNAFLGSKVAALYRAEGKAPPRALATP